VQKSRVWQKGTTFYQSGERKRQGRRGTLEGKRSLKKAIGKIRRLGKFRKGFGKAGKAWKAGKVQGS
jgi:hypothetical protein